MGERPIYSIHSESEIVNALTEVATELERLHVTEDDVSERESIGVNDELDGWCSLGSSEIAHDFYWYGRLEELIERLREMQDGAGPAAVREEFRSYYPG
jgi:hypothetical protein